MERFQDLPRDCRLVPSEPLEYTIVEIGEPLETKGHLSRGADRLWRLTRSMAVVATVLLRRAVVVLLLSVLDVTSWNPENWGRGI